MRAFLGTVLVGLCATLATLAYVRPVLSDAVSGEGFCGLAATAPCRVETLGGGWPVPFVVDDPQISVPNALGLEDHVHAGAFATDAVFFALLAAQAQALRRRRRTARALSLSDPSVPEAVS